MSQDHIHNGLEELLDQLSRLAQPNNGPPDEDTPIDILTREFLANNWLNCKLGLLRKTRRIRVVPEPSVAPRKFRFEIDCRYKWKQAPRVPVELMPGPVRGAIYLRDDFYVNGEEPAIAVALDRDLAFFHPNHCPQTGFLCLGELPENPFPFPLDLLLENLVFPIVSYQNCRPEHALDQEAVRYFAHNPEAMRGLELVEPLY